MVSIRHANSGLHYRGAGPLLQRVTSVRGAEATLYDGGGLPGAASRRPSEVDTSAEMSSISFSARLYLCLLRDVPATRP